MKKISILSLAAVGVFALTGCGKKSGATKVSQEKFYDKVQELITEEAYTEAAALYLDGVCTLKYSFSDIYKNVPGYEDTKYKGTVDLTYGSYDYRGQTRYIVWTNDATFLELDTVPSMVYSFVNQYSLFEFLEENMTKEEFLDSYYSTYTFYTNPMSYKCHGKNVDDGVTYEETQTTSFYNNGLPMKQKLVGKASKGNQSETLTLSLQLTWSMPEEQL